MFFKINHILFINAINIMFIGTLFSSTDNILFLSALVYSLFYLYVAVSVYFIDKEVEKMHSPVYDFLIHFMEYLNSKQGKPKA